MRPCCCQAAQNTLSPVISPKVLEHVNCICRTDRKLWWTKARPDNHIAQTKMRIQTIIGFTNLVLMVRILVLAGPSMHLRYFDLQTISMASVKSDSDRSLLDSKTLALRKESSSCCLNSLPVEEWGDDLTVLPINTVANVSQFLRTIRHRLTLLILLRGHKWAKFYAYQVYNCHSHKRRDKRQTWMETRALPALPLPSLARHLNHCCSSQSRHSMSPQRLVFPSLTTTFRKSIKLK